MEQELASAQKLADAAIAFAVAYGFQILGAVLLFAIGLKVADWWRG